MYFHYYCDGIHVMEVFDKNDICVSLLYIIKIELFDGFIIVYKYYDNNQ